MTLLPHTLAKSAEGRRGSRDGWELIPAVGLDTRPDRSSFYRGRTYWGFIMRLLPLLVVGACLAFPLSVEAAPLAPSDRDLGASSRIELAAGPKCGPHAHYVRGHRNHAGQYVKGRCIRDRRHT
jgi:hypothetical protein